MNTLRFVCLPRLETFNEPCPCGSGKKFKQCCGRRSMLH
ncbi:SEC-C metal-binding domain-containing protein [Leisingera sp. JC1]